MFTIVCLRKESNRKISGINLKDNLTRGKRI